MARKWTWRLLEMTVPSTNSIISLYIVFKDAEPCILQQANVFFTFTYKPKSGDERVSLILCIITYNGLSFHHYVTGTNGAAGGQLTRKWDVCLRKFGKNHDKRMARQLLWALNIGSRKESWEETIIRSEILRRIHRLVLKLTEIKLQIAVRRNNFIIFIWIKYATCCSHISAIFIHKYTLSKRRWTCAKM